MKCIEKQLPNCNSKKSKEIKCIELEEEGKGVFFLVGEKERDGGTGGQGDNVSAATGEQRNGSSGGQRRKVKQLREVVVL